MPMPHSTRAALVVAFLASAAQGQPLPGGDLAVQLESIDQSVQRSGNELTLIEKQFTKTPEPTDEAARDERYAQAEIAYLLGDLENASLLFYDLVASNEFHASPNYPNALFYLSDALYQQKNYLGARLYLKQLLQLRRAHYADALARYLEIAGRFNEFAGIDEYMNQARGLAGALLRQGALDVGLGDRACADEDLAELLLHHRPNVGPAGLERVLSASPSPGTPHARRRPSRSAAPPCP